jgi:uncharacterized membrane protein
MTKKTKLLIISILAIIAFFNAFYLSYDWLFVKSTWSTVYSLAWSSTWAPSFCDVSETISCSKVLENPLAHFFWIPFPVPAMIVYPLILILSILWYLNKIQNIFKILIFIAVGWLMYNWYFIYMETFKIWAVCPLCMICTAIIITIWWMSLTEIINKRNKNV